MARQTGKPMPEGQVDAYAGVAIDESCQWDEEAIDLAFQRAQALDGVDEDAARQLRAQANWAQQRLKQAQMASTPRGVPNAYDPMAIFAKMAKFYRFSHSEMNAMHFPTFFGYIREMALMQEKEQAEYDRIKRERPGQQALSPQETESFVKQAFPVAMPYEGEVIPYG